MVEADCSTVTVGSHPQIEATTPSLTTNSSPSPGPPPGPPPPPLMIPNRIKSNSNAVSLNDALQNKVRVSIEICVEKSLLT